MKRLSLMWMMSTLLTGLVILPGGVTRARAAAPSPPKLLYLVPGTTFVVRPPTMSFTQTNVFGDFTGLVGPHTTSSELRRGKNTRIRWLRWGPSAVGEATYTVPLCEYDDARPTSCSTGRWMTSEVDVRASRVRQGRFTRLAFGKRVHGGFAASVIYALRHVRHSALAFGDAAYEWCQPGRARCIGP
jgi:hypothetical protein